MNSENEIDETSGGASLNLKSDIIIPHHGPEPPQVQHDLVASLNLESSNQLFETLEEWNDYLERQRARSGPGTIAILIGQC